jgi:hypothetical protein
MSNTPPCLDLGLVRLGFVDGRGKTLLLRGCFPYCCAQAEKPQLEAPIWKKNGIAPPVECATVYTRIEVGSVRSSQGLLASLSWLAENIM